MIDVEEIKSAITQLSPEARAELRAWYEQFEADAWDRQIEADSAAGRFNALAQKAVEAFRAGNYTEL
jgi:hypothetical protein